MICRHTLALSFFALPMIADSGETKRIESAVHYFDLPYFEDIRHRYEQHTAEFERLAFQLAMDSEVKEIYCDDNLIAVTTEEETFYDGEGDPYSTKYEKLCRFTWKVTAKSNQDGVWFPHRFFEVGPTLVTSSLERRSVAASQRPVCTRPFFREDKGSCAVPINDTWSATYDWEPF